MSDIKVRIGQQNAIKVVSGFSGDISDTSKNVIGGIASVTQLYVSGISTFNGTSYFSENFYANSASIDYLSGIGISYSGIATLGIATIGDLYVSGVSTFVGVGTFSSDLYVGGNLYANTEFVVDYISGNQINISGIGTIETLDVTTGTIDYLTNTNLNTSGIGTIETLDTTTGTIDYLSGTNVSYSGIGTIETLDVTTGTIDYLSGTDISYSGIGTIGTLNATGISFSEASGINISVDQIETDGISYTTYNTNSVAYFNNDGLLYYTDSPDSPVNYTNYILTTTNGNVPVWSSLIDGGTY